VCGQASAVRSTPPVTGSAITGPVRSRTIYSYSILAPGAALVDAVKAIETAKLPE